MTPPYEMGGYQACILKMESKPDLYIFFTVLSGPLWIAIFCLYLFFAASLYLVSWFGSRIQKPTGHKEAALRFSQCLDYFSLASIQYGPDASPTSYGGKLLRLAWVLKTNNKYKNMLTKTNHKSVCLS